MCDFCDRDINITKVYITEYNSGYVGDDEELKKILERNAQDPRYARCIQVCHNCFQNVCHFLYGRNVVWCNKRVLEKCCLDNFQSFYEGHAENPINIHYIYKDVKTCITCPSEDIKSYNFPLKTPFSKTEYELCNIKFCKKCLDDFNKGCKTWIIYCFKHFYEDQVLEDICEVMKME